MLAPRKSIIHQVIQRSRTNQHIKRFLIQLAIHNIVMEEELYIEVERALGLITRSLEEYREAAPVTTMTSVLFGAF